MPVWASPLFACPDACSVCRCHLTEKDTVSSPPGTFGIEILKYRLPSTTSRSMKSTNCMVLFPKPTVSNQHVFVKSTERYLPCHDSEEARKKYERPNNCQFVQTGSISLASLACPPFCWPVIEANSKCADAQIEDFYIEEEVEERGYTESKIYNADDRRNNSL